MPKTTGTSFSETSTAFKVELDIQAKAGIEILRNNKRYIQHTLRIHDENMRLGEKLMMLTGARYTIVECDDSVISVTDGVKTFSVPREHVKEHFLHVIEEEIS